MTDLSKRIEKKMKTLKENLKTVATYASADTTNAENFPAFVVSAEA